MGEAEKISRDALVVVTGLIISVAWIRVGLVETPEAPGLSSVLDPAVLAYSLVVTFAGLILIPICARDNR